MTIAESWSDVSGSPRAATSRSIEAPFTRGKYSAASQLGFRVVSLERRPEPAQVLGMAQFSTNAWFLHPHIEATKHAAAPSRWRSFLNGAARTFGITGESIGEPTQVPQSLNSALQSALAQIEEASAVVLDARGAAPTHGRSRS